MKLIFKITLFGAFFCGTLGQASTHQRLLSFDQFMSLNTAQKAAYIKTLRDAFANAERAQLMKGLKNQAANKIPQLPNFTNVFYDQAVADIATGPCIYAGNISEIRYDKCMAIYGGVCKDPKYPTACNPLLFGKNVCVDVPTSNDINTATKVCTDKTPYSLEQIANSIADTKENLAEWDHFKGQLDGYCNIADPTAWKNLHQKDLCDRLEARAADMKRFIDAKLASVPAEAPHVDTAACQAPPPIRGGCDFTIDAKTYHINYGLNNGQFFTQLHVPENEEFSTVATSNCEDGKTLPDPCDLYISKITLGIEKSYKISGANPTGFEGKTMCNVDHYGVDSEPPKEDVACSPAALGFDNHIFCVAIIENKYKAVIWTDDNHGAEAGVRICESEFPNRGWKVGAHYTVSDLDMKVNGAMPRKTKEHGRWFFFDEGKKKIKMRFRDGTEIGISRSKPKDQPMVKGRQVCEFTPSTLVGTNPPQKVIGKYFTSNGLPGDDNSSAQGPNSSR